MSFFGGSNMYGGYGPIKILNGCSISVEPGEVSVIVGPNGAGKSTAMKALLGLVELTSGDVFLDGKSIDALNTRQRVMAGIGFVPQTENIFPGLTVDENLSMGGYLRADSVADTKQEVFKLFPVLGDRRKQLAGTLSGGQRQQLAVGRALMTNPQVLLLDEPTAGVSPNVSAQLLYEISNLKTRDMAIIMVEQNARQALEIADTGYVLVMGENKFTGSGPDLLKDREVKKTFLGG
ncbi:High-affinity branched-chain amino acid transport ATP-binding protein LivF [Roseovarius sp. THAF27]|uniref:ABC transporter ATP-binding protein n=2 Tax=Sulfitobacter TaxID=60136 RepID=A0A1J0WIV5_9RHOB|nr:MULTISPECIES: ABC transporter ATP-binding protein [Roseobacteraceae]APE44263.1 ABC transporter ATP-binding protein [Sulfitobacter alexandrii]QFT47584.1 High-affinity branched-chain amino acid transport ATP-binding protein LivF [Roseivivax sp. THAF40]QFT79672.1 High-affinity branched-chain amino acid transport ATP-binding protein LivF [Roseovarius sp. THAF27]UOA15600.1 High-affinity branched-chain amino acid transport ATP-binding protein LivF [Sulfitobacter dubius]